jgi:hypothetical protein
MPPWRKGRGLGPFTSARPAAGPLLSSQLLWPQTTQDSRSRRSWPRHEHLWRVARPLRAADVVRLPTDVGPPTGRTRLAVLGVDRYGGGSGPGARRLDRRLYSRTRRGCAPGGTHVGWESMRTQPSAASPSEPRDRPSGSGVGPGSGVARCRRDAAPLRSCGLGSGPEVWRETRRLLLRRGEQAPAVSGTKSSSCTHGGCQATSPPVPPPRQRVRSALSI